MLFGKIKIVNIKFVYYLTIVIFGKNLYSLDRVGKYVKTANNILMTGDVY